jgi:hypothetical protein
VRLVPTRVGTPAANPYNEAEPGQREVGGW